MPDPEKTQWRIPLKNKFAEKQLKQSPAVKQYKIIQAGTLVKSSIEMYVKLQRFLNLRYWSTGGGT
jgi:hypothetical protein